MVQPFPEAFHPAICGQVVVACLVFVKGVDQAPKLQL